MLVLMIAPGEKPRRAVLDDTLEAMQAAVGGSIQAVYPFEEPVALVCHEVGKLLGFPANRGLRDETGQLYDIVCGTFFLCGAPPDSEHFTSLTEEQLGRYESMFRRPELFVALGGKLLCLPI